MFDSKTHAAGRELAAQFETPFGIDLVGLMQAVNQIASNSNTTEPLQLPPGYHTPNYPHPASFGAN